MVEKTNRNDTTKQIEKITYNKHGQAAANPDRIVQINFHSVKNIFMEAFDLFAKVIDAITFQIIIIQL